MKSFVIVAGTLMSDKTVSELRQFLTDIGLTPSDGRSDYVRIAECLSFEFRRGFDHEYQIVGDADTVEKLLEDVTLISSKLAENHLEHSFEVYDHQGEVAGEFDYPYKINTSIDLV